jgi:tRNA threonylcarbamoyl adenosine modification protein YeaZ
MILALDASGPRAGFCISAPDGTILARAHVPTRDRLIETLPPLIASAIANHPITAVAVTIGPGSFTGLRTAIALAAGYAAAAGIPLHAITVAEAYGAAFPSLHRPLWVALRARPNRLFLLRNGEAEALGDTAIPRPGTPIALAGDAANEVAARLAAANVDVLLTNARHIDPAWVAAAARVENRPQHPPTPLYIDPPAAKFPAHLRPPPA